MQTMQIAHSLVSAPSIGLFVEQEFSVRAVQSCRLHMSGVNDVYQLTTEQGAFFLKVYRAGWRGWGNVCYEADLLMHLNRKQISVSLPVANVAEEPVTILNAPEGDRCAVLYEAAPGQQPTWPFYRDTEEAHLLGATLAQIHTAAHDFSSPHPRNPIDAHALLDAPLAAIASFAELTPDGIAPFADAITPLRAELDDFTAHGLTSSVCHGDFHCGNVFLTEDGEATTFDFDACGPGWVAHDLARWRSLAQGADSNASWNAFLAGYEEIAPLTQADKDAVPLFETLRALHWARIKLNFVQRGQGEWWDVGFFLADLHGQIAG